MITQIIYTILFLVGFYAIIQVCELLYHKFNVSVEITRKTAHILGSISSLSFLVFFKSHWYVLVIASTFFLILWISKQKGMFRSIDLIERKSIGSYILPISIYLNFLIFEFYDDNLYFILPVLILAISDPLAGLVGTRYKKAKRIKIQSVKFQKTYVGSLAFFIATYVLTVSTFYFYNISSQNILILGFYFAIALTFMELISNRGFDNLSVPLLTAVLIWIVRS